MLSSERVSRQHARVYGDGEGGFWVADLGSRHGTCSTASASTTTRAGSRAATRSRSTARSCASSAGRRPEWRRGQLPITGTQIVRFDGRRLTHRPRPDQRRRARRPERLALPRRGRRQDGADRAARTSARATARGSTASWSQRAPVDRRGRDRHRPLPAHLRRHRASSPRDDRGALRLDAEDVAVAVKDKQILERRPRSSIEPGEFVAIIGESGAGKSTLIKALAGVASADGRAHHGQRRAGLRPPHRHRLRAPGRDRPPLTSRSARRSATRPACGCRRTRRDEEIDARGRPRAGGARARRARRHADRLALGRAAQAHRGRRRAAEPPEPPLPRRADDGPRSRARDEDDGAAARAREQLARRHRRHPRDQEPRASATRSWSWAAAASSPSTARPTQRRRSSAPTTTTASTTALDDRPAVEWRARIRAQVRHDAGAGSGDGRRRPRRRAVRRPARAAHAAAERGC